MSASSPTGRESYIGHVGPVHLTDDFRAAYEQQFERASIRLTASNELEMVSNRVIAAKKRYLDVGTSLGIPWWFIAALHYRESSLNFRCHLHNGDPLSARTVNVPAGRPKNGTPPFRWEDSAIDALTIEGLEQWDDWTIPGALFAAEAYNGWGCLRRGLVSPYLWSGTDEYAKGKFVADHKYDPAEVDAELGVATIWKFFDNRGLVEDWT